MDGQPPPPIRRTGWLALAVIGMTLAVLIAAGSMWAAVEIRSTGSGSGWQVVTGGGSGVLFWGWMAAGAWRRAHEPEPDLYAPVPVPRSGAFVAANLALAVLFTGMVGGGLWAGVRAARETERLDLIRHRVVVAARDADVTVARIRSLAEERQEWLAGSTAGAPAGEDPVARVLPVEGAEVVDVAVDGPGAAVLFRPDEGPPCVVLDVDADDLISTRRTNDCD